MALSRPDYTDTFEQKVIAYTHKLVAMTSNLIQIVADIQQHPEKVAIVQLEADGKISFTGRFVRYPTSHPTAVPIALQNFHDNIIKLIIEIEQHARILEKTEITNPYLNYFLLMVTRYNGLFLRITELTTEQAAASSDMHKIDILTKLGALPIHHPLLGNANHTEVSYRVIHHSPGSVFRAATHQEYNGRMRYYYRANDVDTAEKSGFVEAYKVANKCIGLDTQLSNVVGFFTPSGRSQLKNHFMRGRDIDRHEIERTDFISAWKKVKSGAPLTASERVAFESGNFYRGTGASIKFKLPILITSANAETKATHFHIGHASELVHTEAMSIAFDPINYACASKVLYGRKTEPGIPTDCYPLIPVFCYSHNHYDHMDEKTIREATRGIDPLIIVPAGDAHYLRSWGFQHVVELTSWDDEVEVNIRDLQGIERTVNIHAIPARHASNREIAVSMPDINASLYMGFMIHQKGSSHVIVITGDTGVQDEDHYQQLADYLLRNNLTVSSACIAAGPDRPRRYMECTHQSTADAMTVHARLNVINANVIARRRLAQELSCDVTAISPLAIHVSLEDFRQSGCNALGYHQGCYRLGVLNYNDVDGTLTRTLAVLSFYGDKDIGTVLLELQREKNLLDLLKKSESRASIDSNSLDNYYFSIMDNFEREGILNTLQIYQRLNLPLTAKDVKNYICQHTYLPQPGLLLDFNQSNSTQHSFSYDYQRLIVNRDPSGRTVRAYEEFMKMLVAKYSADMATKILIDSLATSAPLDIKALTKTMMTLYCEKYAYTSSTRNGHAIVGKFLEEIETRSPNNIINALIKLHGQINNWQTFDEEQREEGHYETISLMLAGLLDNDNAVFTKQFLADFAEQQRLQSQASIDSAMEPQHLFR